MGELVEIQHDSVMGQKPRCQAVLLGQAKQEWCQSLVLGRTELLTPPLCASHGVVHLPLLPQAPSYCYAQEREKKMKLFSVLDYAHTFLPAPDRRPYFSAPWSG